MARDNNLQANDLDNYLLKNNRRFKSFIYKKRHVSPKRGCGGNVERVLQETFSKRRTVEVEE